MMPWGHLAVGYLLYSAGVRVARGHGPRELPSLALVFGTQLPDLIDKPLNWWFSVFDGRAFGHSLLIMIPLSLAVYVVARRHDHGDLGAAFGSGLVIHLLTDGWLAILAGSVRANAPYLLWPIYPTPTYPKDSLADHVVAQVEAIRALPWGSPAELLTSWLAIQALLLLVPLSVWMYDGYPGVRTVRWLFRHGVARWS